MTVLVTGGTGFVGLALAEALAKAGRGCVLFGRDPAPKGFAETRWLAETPVVIGDITDPKDISRALATPGLTGLVHLAAITPDAGLERSDPARVVAVNVGGTAELLRLATQRRDLRIIMASSVAIYGDVAVDGSAIDEDRPPSPNSLYGVTKLAAEQTALRLADLHGFDLRVVRLGPVYGPWEWATGVRPVLSPQAQVVDLVRRGEPVLLPRAMASDWIYSRAASGGLAALLSAPNLNHRVYNLGGGAVTSVDDWCAALRDMGVAIVWELADRPNDANVRLSLPRDRAPLSVERLLADTGFDPRRRLPDCARDHAAWLATQGHAMPTRGGDTHAG
jgi:nucleoside-diphosphate-sugar epimerase